MVFAGQPARLQPLPQSQTILYARGPWDLFAASFSLSEIGMPPYSFPNTNKKTGIYLDILEEISKITGEIFVPKYLPAARTRILFTSGQIDIVPGVNPAWDKKRKDISVYSIPFSVSKDVIFFRKGEGVAETNAADLIGKRIATVRGYYYPGYEELFENNKIHRIDLNNELQVTKFVFTRNRDSDAGFY